MNPMTNVKNIKKLSELELKRNLKTSWHDQYKDSAWIFIGGLPYDITEGDIICVFSQYGEVVNLNLVRDKVTGKSKGFCFLCYEDQRSTVLAVDNLNGIKLLGRTIRVDHVSDYKPPKVSDKLDEETQKLRAEGCAFISTHGEIEKQNTEVQLTSVKKEKKDKSKTKTKKQKRKKRKKRKKPVSSGDSSNENSSSTSDSESDDSSEDNVASPQHKKYKHTSKKSGKKYKKKSKTERSDGDSSTENETIRNSREKCRKLVEKIKTLEAVLSYSRKTATNSSLSEKQSGHEETDCDEDLEKAKEKSFGNKQNEKIKITYPENGTLNRKLNRDVSMSRNQTGGDVDIHDFERLNRSEDKTVSRIRERSRDRFRPQERNREREWDHSRDRHWNRERFSRDRDYEKRRDRGYERLQEHYRK